MARHHWGDTFIGTLRWCSAAVILFGTCHAQTPGEAAQSTPSTDTKTLHVSTQLVVVDVVVEDKNGQAVHGLKKEDFTLLENGETQLLKNFEEHRGDEPAPEGPTLPAQPPGVFTDYSPVPPDTTLNVLLLDSLNTPTKDQSYVRLQLQQYVKKAAPGTRIAILGLGSRLYFLQGFTSDPAVLKDAVDHKLMPRGSVLLDDPTGSNADDTSGAAGAIADGMQPGQILSNLQTFEAEQEAFQKRLRMEMTLDAFSNLAHYLAAFPGRKNLIWFSGAFPLDIVPDLTLPNPFMVMGGDLEAQYRETTNMLTRAQIAVYPVDARGLMSDPSLDAAHSGAGYSKKPQNFAAEMSGFGDSQAQEHMTMNAIAQDTGGQAFFNTNDLATAVTKSISAGSNYYTLTYTPTDHEWNGSFRTIKIALNYGEAAKNLRLAYRKGYFADDPKKVKSVEVSAGAAGVTPENRVDASYAAAAMSRGAPMPSDIIFRARVLPASTSTEDKLAVDNKPNPKSPIKGPYRRFDIDFSAVAQDFALAAQPDGKHTDKIEFTAYVYDSDGKLLNLVGKTISLNLTPELYKKFLASRITYHLEISAPAKGESYLRIGIHDVPANTFGVIEVPTSSIVHLDPPVYPTNHPQAQP